MKLPYGISDFKEIATKGYFYCDRTDRIPLLEDYTSILFLRPRRFGKSLLVSMLANYYDLARADGFEEVFGNLLIGKNPTELHNKYFILKWDFSCVNASGSADNIRQSLYNHINRSIQRFIAYYSNYPLPEIKINKDDAFDSLASLVNAVSMSDYSIYLLIDEYDNFANEVMMSSQANRENYEALVHGDGLLKTLFKTIKASAGESLFDRSFITGVSPVVMSDMTSGYNIAKNIYLEARFNDLCGLTEKEIRNALERIEEKCGFKEGQGAAAFDIMQEYYNGYSFDYKAHNRVYNPTLALYFVDSFYKNCEYPEKMLDSNLAADEAKLEYISGIPGGRQLLLDLLESDNQIDISEIEERFGIKRMLKAASKDFSFMASFLYYFGVLTMAGRSSRGKRKLKVPNMVIQSLYVERIREMLLPEPMERDQGIWAAEKLFEEGDIKPVCEFIEQKYFKVFSNRDYISANEFSLKTAFLTLLYNDSLYIMDSEPEISRGYADLTMIIRPDMRQYDILDILLEFKFVHLNDVKLTGEQASQLTQEELEAIFEIKAKMKEAKEQAARYGDALEKKYNDLRLHKFAVVSLGFERLWAERV
jgi:hypothetical protein